MSGLYCGIDIGSTNVKVVLLDEEGRVAWAHVVPTPRCADDGGVATDPLVLVALLEEMIVAGWRETGRGRPLRALAITGVGEDGVGVTSALQPVDVVLPWFDQRAVAEATELRHSPASSVRAGVAIGADRTAAKWLWLRRHRPDALRDAACWIALTDYPAAHWTGRPFMSRTLAARTACYDVYARAWLEPLLRAAGAPRLPPVVDAGTVVGTVAAGALRQSGAASAATLVVAGGHDHPVAASAIRRIDPAARVDSMGTANLVYGETAGPVAPRFDPFVAFSVPVSGGAGMACLGVMELSAALEPARAAGDLFARFLQAPGPGGEPPEAEEPPGEVPVTTPLGIRRRLEAATFHARRMFEAMDAVGAAGGTIFAAGGWARSGAFLTLRASIFGQPVHVIDEPELTAVGAALIAAEGAGANMPSLAATRAIRTVEPVATWVRAYEGLYPAFRRRIEATERDKTTAAARRQTRPSTRTDP